MKGTVIKSTGSWYEVTGEDGRQIQCRLKGKFRLDEITSTNPVAVGDIVEVNYSDSDDDVVITEICERDNYIVRQSPKRKNARHIIAANIDQAFLVVTFARPRTSTGFIDRFLVTAEAYHIPTHLVFNKQDDFNDKELKKQQVITDMYRSVGYPIHLVSSITGEGMDQMEALLKDKSSLLAGHSGVGKSTFLNALLPDLEQRTREVSKATGKGLHTTTFAEMFTLPYGGSVIDTPGVKEFGVLDFEAAEVSDYYIEMKELRENCKFGDCLHENEPGCAVKVALENEEINPERYKNYLNILNDVKAAAKSWS